MARIYPFADLGTSQKLVIKTYGDGCDALVFYVDEAGKACMGALSRGTATALMASGIVERPYPDLSFADYRSIVEEGAPHA
jgi:hypothetical protein